MKYLHIGSSYLTQWMYGQWLEQMKWTMPFEHPMSPMKKGRINGI